MGVEELLEDATVRTPAVDIDRARRSVDERAGRRTRRRVTMVGAGAVVAVLVAAAAFSLMRSDGDVTVAVVTDGTTAVSPTTGPSSDGAPGWALMAEAPISARTGHVAVSTGDEMVIWGGTTYDEDGGRALDDGAAYSFATGEWRQISVAPISGRGEALAAWTGEEVVIVGGSDVDGIPVSDAAAWDPRTDEWRTVPVPDLAGAGSGSAAAIVWADGELILVGVARPGAEAAEVVAVDVETGALRDLGSVPSPDETERRHAAFWTGTHVLVATIEDRQPVTIHPLDPESGEWGAAVTTAVPGLQVSADSIVWTGDALVVENHLGPGAIVRPGATPEVTALPPSGSSLWFPASAVDDDVVTVGDRWLELGSLTWHDTEPMPGPFREVPSVIAEGGRSYVWGGDACGPAASCVALADPGPGLIWTPAASTEGDEEPSSAAAVVGDARITLSVEPTDVPGLTIEVGPPVAHEHGWFGHELRLTNTSDRVVRIDDNKTSRVLGEPSGILVAEPSCGYIRDESDPGAPVSGGACRDVLLVHRVEPGETVVQQWWTARDLPGLVPGGVGTFHYEKTFEYSIGGADEPLEQHTEVVTITYEIDPTS